VKLIALTAVLLIAISTCAKQRDWQPAIVSDISTTPGEIVKQRSHLIRIDNKTTIVEPLDPFVLETNESLYTFETTDTTYVARNVTRQNGKMLDVTLHGQTKLSVDGMTLHVLDGSGKDVKLKIVQKIARAQ
jgi:hypothetical protein